MCACVSPRARHFIYPYVMLDMAAFVVGSRGGTFKKSFSQIVLEEKESL